MATAILSKRNKEIFEHDGHLYRFDKYVANDKKKAWRCTKRLGNGNKCRGRVYTDLDNNFLEIVSKHTEHYGDAASAEVARALTTLKQRAIETQELPSQIRTTSLQTLSLAARARIQNKPATDKIIQRVRTITSSAPVQPTDRASIKLPENYKIYEHLPGNFEKFLLADSGEGDTNRILIFGRKSITAWISHVKKIFVDGTFSLAPPLFSQIFVIMVEREGFVMPILYALLPNKHQETYDRMLEMILKEWEHFKPQSISLDYEIAVIKTFSNAFSNAKLHGCLFHFVRNIKHRLSSEHLIHRYNTDSDFALQARMIPALAFVPIINIEDAIDVLRGPNVIDNEPNIHENLLPVLNYFEDNYVGRLGRNNYRSRPLFDPTIWSCYDRTLNDEARTNNYAEAAHRRLQAEFGVDHPNLWKFIGGLWRVQKSTDQRYEEFVSGVEPPKKRQKYQQADDRIISIVKNFKNREIIEYLRGIAHNFTL